MPPLRERLLLFLRFKCNDPSSGREEEAEEEGARVDNETSEARLAFNFSAAHICRSLWWSISAAAAACGAAVPPSYCFSSARDLQAKSSRLCLLKDSVPETVRRKNSPFMAPER